MKHSYQTPVKQIVILPIYCLLISFVITAAQQKTFVRVGTQLCESEKEFVQARQQTVGQHLQAVTGMTIANNKMPKIALCTSGGGMRAMVSTLGSISGMQYAPSKNFADQIQTYAGQFASSVASFFGYQSAPQLANPSLFNCCSYFSAVSGSTWAVTGFYSSRLAINDYINFLTTQLDGKDFVRDLNIESIVTSLQKKQALGQPISLIDIYGCLLAQQLFETQNNLTPLEVSIDQGLVANSNLPLPINNCVVSLANVAYPWVEFTPFEVGSTDLNTFIPTSAFNTRFNNYLSLEQDPACNLSFALGLWGSAMSVNAREFFDFIIDPTLQKINFDYLQEKFGATVAKATTLLQSILQEMTDKIDYFQLYDYKQSIIDSLLGMRISPAQVNNWCHGMHNHPFEQQEYLTLIDAGISLNIGFAPILRPERAVDIIIVLDYALNNTNGSELARAQQFAAARNLKFPAIDYSKVGTVCSVHGDVSDPTAPVIIYMPLVANANYQNGWDPSKQSFTSTYNFLYSADQIKLLAGLTQQNMQDSQPLIIDTIKKWIKAQG